MLTTLITSPVGEPVTLQEAKDHLRVTWSAEDDLITRLIAGAREAFERETGRQILAASWRGYLDRFPLFDHEAIEIAKPPLVDVTAVSYVDTSGVSQVWATSEYDFDVFAGPFAQRGMIYPKPEKEYPLTRRLPNAVLVDFDAGYGVAADVPDEIKEALFAWIGHHYRNRELVVAGNTSIVPALGFEPWIDMDFS